MLPPYSDLAAHWQIDPGLCFLNHGSFGATPLAVLDAQRRWRDQMEREPVRFFADHLEGLLDQCRYAVAPFLGVEADDLAFVHNASTGVSTVINSLRFEPGDELLVSNQEYNACRNAFVNAARRWVRPDGAGPIVRSVTLPFPSLGPDDVERRIMEAVTPATRIVLLSHITSPTGVVMPVERIVANLNARGIDTIVDGAHVPGHIPVNISAIGCAYYTGNFHKWLCSPKGSAFLWVRRDRQDRILPLTISHGFNSARRDRSPFRLNFDFGGTLDPSAFLCIPAALHLLPTLVPERTWLGVMSRNRGMALAARARIAGRLNVPLPAPDEMIANLGAVVLPEHPKDLDDRLMQRATRYHDALQDTLLHRHGIQVPIIRLPGLGALGRSVRLVRISAMLYNTMDQYEYLANALAMELENERLM